MTFSNNVSGIIDDIELQKSPSTFNEKQKTYKRYKNYRL